MFVDLVCRNPGILSFLSSDEIWLKNKSQKINNSDSQLVSKDFNNPWMSPLHIPSCTGAPIFLCFSRRSSIVHGFSVETSCLYSGFMEFLAGWGKCWGIKVKLNGQIQSSLVLQYPQCPEPLTVFMDLKSPTCIIDSMFLSNIFGIKMLKCSQLVGTLHFTNIQTNISYLDIHSAFIFSVFFLCGWICPRLCAFIVQFRE